MRAETGGGGGVEAHLDRVWRGAEGRETGMWQWW